jgi:hypothetical protein
MPRKDRKGNRQVESVQARDRRKNPENAATMRANEKRWREANPEKVKAKNDRNNKKFRQSIREYSLKALYGMTHADYEAMLESQGGVCAICSSDTPRNKNKKYFSVDHCHYTGRVRGILCDPCNILLGRFGDDPARLRSALEYLERTTGS